MISGKTVVVILPAYNAGKTLARTVREIDRTIVDRIILVDDGSSDDTFDVAAALGVDAHRHERNVGYGGNQKTCYRLALSAGADIVVMVHPDYQYTPALIPVAVHLVATGIYQVALGSRILSGGARAGGMPLYKYISNRFLTAAQNLMTGMKLSEYHTGYRAFSRDVLTTLALDSKSNSFLFDNQIIVAAHLQGFRIGEFTCPTRYAPDASSIGFSRSLVYGFGCLWTGVQCFAARLGLGRVAALR